MGVGSTSFYGSWHFIPGIVFIATQKSLNLLPSEAFLEAQKSLKSKSAGASPQTPLGELTGKNCTYGTLPY
jgi:hypothetical protein